MERSNKSIAELLRRHSSDASRSTAEQGGPDEDDYQACSFGRVGLRPQMTFVVRFADGRLKGFPYAQMLGIESDDGQTGFRVEFPGTNVEIRGRNLKRLVRYVCDHRAAQVDESSPQAIMWADPECEMVETIILRRQPIRIYGRQPTGLEE